MPGLVPMKAVMTLTLIFVWIRLILDAHLVPVLQSRTFLVAGVASASVLVVVDPFETGPTLAVKALFDRVANDADHIPAVALADAFWMSNAI